MKLFRHKQAATPDAAVATERHCRACGSALADDQLACLTCGAVDEPAARRDRRWMLPTGGVVGVALFLVTSASFAATTALKTGDPTAIKQEPPQVAQAPAPPPPASGDGSAPQSADEGKGPDLGAGGGAAAPPAPGGDAGGGDAPADDGAGDDATQGGGGSGSGGSSGGGGSSSPAPEPDKPEPKPVTVSEWPAGKEGYTVVVYTFNSKSEAKAKAREVAREGLPAGILNSSSFQSLEPGSWLVYIGEYDSAQEAERASRGFERDYPGEVTYVGDQQSPETQDPQTDASSGSGSQQP